MTEAHRKTAKTIWILVGLHIVILGLAWTVRLTVVPGWVKGPLIDPAAPYSPENAQLLFAVAGCVALDLYLLLLVVARRRGSQGAWVPWVAMAAALLAAEGTLQATLAVTQVTYFRPHPTLHWVVRPHLQDFPNPTGGGLLTTNGDGMRGVSVSQSKPDGELRILVLGDSSNFGHGVEGDEVWSAVLERELQALAPAGVQVVVLNGATPGWTTYQGLEMLDLYGLSYAPDLVLAGFNNDSGPDYLGDRARVTPPGVARAWNRWAFHSEFYLLTREVVLSLARRFAPGGRDYLAREGGSQPRYGRLERASLDLVPRIGREELEQNLRALDEKSAESGARFVWINMPVHRQEPGLVEWFVDWDYRSAAKAVAQESGFALIDVDARWQRSREPGLHIPGHVFHPNARGHQRMGEQVAQAVLNGDWLPGLTGTVDVGGPPPAPAPDTLRLGLSTRTPVHAHVGAVLADQPQLAAAHGIFLEVAPFASGKDQGAAVQAGKLDAFFTCEVPAVRMLMGRPDARIVSSPGALGRIAVVARTDVGRLEGLVGRRVGLTKGSTPAMDWGTWGSGLNAQTVALETDALLGALLSGDVDAVVGWDPWVADWLHQAEMAGTPLHVLAERPFHSVLAVGQGWALGGPDEPGMDPRAQRLHALVNAALDIAASDRDKYDAQVAALSGWPVEVVRAVANRNARLAGSPVSSEPLPALVKSGLERAAHWRHPIPVERLLGLSLLKGQPLPPQGPPGGTP